MPRGNLANECNDMGFEVLSSYRDRRINNFLSSNTASNVCFHRSLQRIMVACESKEMTR
jgi:hypothetical protein